MTRANRAVGAYGERVAARYLIDHGIEVIERNWRCARGEIDIIAQDGDSLVFCEVKTRRSATFGAPIEAIVPEKAKRIRRLAAQWISSRGVAMFEVRFDVVSVRPRRSGQAAVEHLRGAF